MFATAFTPDGIITFIDTIFNDYSNVYILNGAPGTKKSNILDSIYKESILRGYYTEVLHNPLTPHELEHVIIPELNTAILTSNELSNKKFKGKEFFMSDFQFRDRLKSKEELKQAKLNFYTLLNEGLHFLGKAKKTHDIIENYYIPNIDFNSINLLYEKTIIKFLDYEKEYLNSLL